MASQYDDRRKEDRFTTPPHVDCSFASPVLDDFGKVRVTSISRSGIGLISTEEVAPGIGMAVTLVNSVKKFSKTMLVRVVHVTPQAHGTFLVGGTLEPPLTYEELSAFSM